MPMNWFRIAADLIRGAMTIVPEPKNPPAQLPPENVSDVVDLINRHRSDVRLGFQAVTQSIQEQNDQYKQALRVQRRWNYALLTTVAVLAVLVVILYLRP